ncbi:MAG: hypothetical protein RR150_06705 [Clostridia bacterium]
MDYERKATRDIECVKKVVIVPIIEADALRNLDFVVEAIRFTGVDWENRKV